jgi:hypothetical protein
MTLVVPDYVDEVFGALRVAGETLFHVFLDVDVATLTQRIAQDEERIREWRLAQIQRCLAGRASMPQDTLFLDAAKLAPARLAARIMAQIGTAVDARDGKR